MDGNKTISKNNYTVKYPNDNISGSGIVQIIGKGDYTGTLNKQFYIFSDTKYDLIKEANDNSSNSEYKIVIFLNSYKMGIFKKDNNTNTYNYVQNTSVAYSSIAVRNGK